MLKLDSTPDLTDDAWRVAGEAWDAAYKRGRKDGFSLSGSVRGAIDALEEATAQLRDWEIEREAVAVVDEEQRAYDWAMSNAMAEEHAITHPGEQEQESLPF